ncbi:MAG: ABC transporter ATP-binding protein [Lachnospiraceae bacterium]|nr:ABC transporter ATP-binding protein [Lachnospiraceae bacterium]
MIEAKNIEFKYKAASGFFVNDITLDISEGQICCLLGKNGCGKTTLLKLLYGMLTPSSGSIYYKGRKICAATLSQYHEEVGFVGHCWCNESLTLEHNVGFLSLLYPSFDRKYYESLLKKAGIEADSDKVFSAFSAGEKIKSEIAFVLARHPKLLLMDEPLANLDTVFKTDILEILQDEVAENGLGILLSTHLLDEISDICDRIAVMDKGSLTAFGDRFEILGENEDKDLRDLVKNTDGSGPRIVPAEAKDPVRKAEVQI